MIKARRWASRLIFPQSVSNPNISNECQQTTAARKSRHRVQMDKDCCCIILTCSQLENSHLEKQSVTCWITLKVQNESML